jgi:hypothetical protein
MMMEMNECTHVHMMMQMNECTQVHMDYCSGSSGGAHGILSPPPTVRPSQFLQKEHHAKLRIGRHTDRQTDRPVQSQSMQENNKMIVRGLVSQVCKKIIK